MQRRTRRIVAKRTYISYVVQSLNGSVDWQTEAVGIIAGFAELHQLCKTRRQLVQATHSNRVPIQDLWGNFTTNFESVPRKEVAHKTSLKNNLHSPTSISSHDIKKISIQLYEHCLPFQTSVTFCTYDADESQVKMIEHFDGRKYLLSTTVFYLVSHKML